MTAHRDWPDGTIWPAAALSSCHHRAALCQAVTERRRLSCKRPASFKFVASKDVLAVKTRRARWVVPCNRVALKVERCLLGWELKPTHGTLVMALEPLHNAVKMEWVAAWHDLQGVHVATPIEEA